jgi:hypothetical protein
MTVFIFIKSTNDDKFQGRYEKQNLYMLQIYPTLFTVVLKFKAVEKIVKLLLFIEIKSQLTPSTLQLDSLNISKQFD